MPRSGSPVTCRPYETRRGLGWAWRSCPALMVSPPSALPFVATLWLPHSAPNAAAATTDLLVGIGYGRQHFLYFFPLPHGHGSLRPTLADRGDARVFCWTLAASSQGKPPGGRTLYFGAGVARPALKPRAISTSSTSPAIEISTASRRNASRIASIASTAPRSIKAHTAKPAIVGSVSACGSSIRTRMPTHSVRHSGCRAAISLIPDKAVETAGSGFDRSDRNAERGEIAACPIMPNTAGSSSAAASSSSAALRSASNGKTASSARNCPKARQACVGAHTSLLVDPAWFNAASQAMRIKSPICSR